MATVTHVRDLFQNQMRTIEHYYPTDSELDLAIVKLGAYMKFILPLHGDMLRKHPEASRTYFDRGKYLGMTNGQIRRFFRSNPTLEPLEDATLLDDVYHYFRMNGGFDSSTLKLIDKRFKAKGDRWLSKGLLNKHLSLMTGPDRGNILSRDPETHRYKLKLRGSLIDMRLPYELKRAFAAAPIEGVLPYSKPLPMALAFSRPRSKLIKEGPLGERHVEFEQRVIKLGEKFAQDVEAAYLEIMFPGMGDQQIFEQLNDAVPHGTPEEETRARWAAAKMKRQAALSGLPLIVIAPMGDEQLERFKRKDE